MLGRTITAICAIAVITVVPSVAEADPTLVAVDVVGETVEGGTLTASVQATDLGSNTTTEIGWLRCDALEPECAAIAGAGGGTYVLTAADVGSRIAVTATLRNKPGKVQDSGTSEPSEIVRAAPQPEPDPTPESPAEPEPTPDPVPTSPGGGGGTVGGGGGGGGTGGDFVQEGVTPISPVAQYEIPPALRYLRPFPVVRIRGELARGGARVTLLRVKAGRRAVVRVRCRGRGCPVKRLRRGPGRLRTFHRFLPAGTRIAIRVTRPGRVGKHVRLRIRAGRAPARVDACVVPGSRGPSACPAP